MPIVGLNLGKTSFRAAEMEKKKDQIILHKYGLYEGHGLNLNSESEEELNAYAAALNNFFNEMAFSTPEVVIGLDENNVFMRVIKLPPMNDKELETSVRIEAEQYIPVPINDVNLSFQRLDADFVDKSKVNVQIVAARKTILTKYVTILRKAKLIPKAIEPETLALGRLFGDSKESPMGTIILEMGFSATLIIVVYAGYVRFSRTVPVGGDALTKAIQQGLNLDFMQAEEYKKIYGMDPSQVDGKIYAAAKPIIDSLILEINRAGMFFTNHHPSASIKRIVLTGGTALMPGLLLYIASNMEYEVELANPIKSIELNPKIESSRSTLVQQGPLYSLAVGLGLKGLS
jgi:type IV pilus assembly protein PilM